MTKLWSANTHALTRNVNKLFYSPVYPILYGFSSKRRKKNGKISLSLMVALLTSRGTERKKVSWKYCTLVLRVNVTLMSFALINVTCSNEDYTTII